MQDSGGSGQGDVDWDAVFRTIDHQGQGANVAVGVAGGSGSLQSGARIGIEYPSHPQWASQSDAAGHLRPPEGDQASEAALLEYFGQQWNRGGGGPSNHRRELSAVGPRTMDPSSGLGFNPDPDSDPSQRSSIGHSAETYDLAFRAMLGDDNEALVPPPQNRSLRGRRRSRSLGPRRTLSALQTDLGPLTGPLTSHHTFPQHILPSPNTPHRFAIPPTLLHHNNPDVYSFFPPQNQGEYQASTAGPSTPAPTPYHPQPHPRPSRGTKRQSISTSGSQSQRPTPLNSAHPSPQAYTSSTSHSGRNRGHDPPSSNDQGSSMDPTPDGELDSEDKRARNTQASARFRAKRKAHINDVERQITQLESRSTTLVKQVEDLRKENGFLKDMVQLKYGLDVDKRM